MALCLEYFIEEGSKDSSDCSADEDEVVAGGWDVSSGRQEGNQGSRSTLNQPVDEISIAVDNEIFWEGFHWFTALYINIQFCTYLLNSNHIELMIKALRDLFQVPGFYFHFIVTSVVYLVLPNIIFRVYDSHSN